jgi:predicted aminopeptidase
MTTKFMRERIRRVLRPKAMAGALCWVALAGSLTGCRTAQFYRQAFGGELEILRHRRPLSELEKEPTVSAKLKEKFALVTELRAFAQKELHLPADNHYETYVDLHRRYAVWDVHAAAAASLEPKKWWYPLVGSLKYRGYFSEPAAQAYAARLKKAGNDVYVEGVEAYSTLGWFADPLLNTFIFNPDSDLAEIIFHELTHQRLFLSGDTDFNEAFATTVGEEGVRRWLAAARRPADAAQYEIELQRNRQFVAMVMRTRQRLADLYGDSDDSQHHRKRTAQPPPWMEEEKERITRELRQAYARLKISWGGRTGYDVWMQGPLNNAQLNTIAVYYELVPGFRKLLLGAGGDLERFYEAVEGMRKLSKDERHHRLKFLAGDVQAEGSPTDSKYRRNDVGQAGGDLPPSIAIEASQGSERF